MDVTVIVTDDIFMPTFGLETAKVFVGIDNSKVAIVLLMPYIMLLTVLKAGGLIRQVCKIE